MITKQMTMAKKYHRRPRNSPTSYSDSSEDDYLQNNKINVGQNYQATIPKLIPTEDRDKEFENEPIREQIQWSNENCNLTEYKIGRFVKYCMSTYQYNPEQALGMLYWHKFNIKKACKDMFNYTPVSLITEDNWTMKDEFLFELYHKQIMQDYKQNDFAMMKKFLPHKSMGSILRYYYTRFFRFPNTKRRLSPKNDENDENLAFKINV